MTKAKMLVDQRPFNRAEDAWHCGLWTDEPTYEKAGTYGVSANLCAAAPRSTKAKP